MIVAVTMLHNTETDRCHPLIFRDAPLPGPDAEKKPRRLKSAEHHTSGFSTLAEAVSSVRDNENMWGAVHDFAQVDE